MAGMAALSSFMSLIRLKCLRLDGCYRSRISHLAGIGALSAAQICYRERVHDPKGAANGWVCSTALENFLPVLQV
jgi:hypothetical protein